MAHLSHKLPWKQLTSNFRYAESPRSLRHRTNLVPVKGVEQKVNIEHFAKQFEETITELSAATRAEYGECKASEGIDPQESTVDSRAKAVMEGPLKYARDAGQSGGCGCCCPLHLHPSTHHATGMQSCETFTDPHALNTWLVFFGCSSCCERIGYGEIVNQTKIMLMHGLMDPLARLASHPNVDFEKLFWFPFDNGGANGWSELLEAALSAYIVLNVLYLMPNTWPSFAGQTHEESQIDYRRTAVYQRMVIVCTATQRYDVHTLPHRFFFGIPRDALSLRASSAEEPLVGLFPLNTLLAPEYQKKHFPSVADVDAVGFILRRKGLPLEIVQPIMDLASYVPLSRLKIPDDPLHAENEDELKKYLSYCWKLLVRCGALANLCGTPINWAVEVKARLMHLFYRYPGYHKVLERVTHDYRPGNWIRSTVY